MSDAANPLDAGAIGTPERRAGLWRASDASGKTLGLIAVNPDSSGAKVHPRSQGEVESWLSGLSGGREVAWLSSATASDASPETPVIARSNSAKDTPFDLGLLTLGALLALAELAMGRWFSHATGAAASPGLSGTLATSSSLPVPSTKGDAA
jgi:hypothetical protein